MGKKYRIGDEWTVKGNDWLNKNERVTIRDLKGHRHSAMALVEKKLNPAETGWISVKKLKKRVK